MFIASDIDGCLTDHDNLFTSEFSEISGKKVTTFHLQGQLFKPSDPVVVEQKKMVFTLDYYESLPPAEGCIYVMKQLSKMCKILLHTARDESLRDVTERWLAKYGIPYDRLVMACDYQREASTADFIIEDNPAYTGFRETAKVLVPAHPYNVNTKYIRVGWTGSEGQMRGAWSEILGFIKASVA